MPRFVYLSLLLLLVGVSPAWAQGNTAQAGDPVIAALVDISAPDEEGQVTIEGTAGAVFPAAEVIIRNLYTGDLLATTARVNGSFSARMFGGPGSAPFWLSAVTRLPQNWEDNPGSLPGGPGTIVHGSSAPAPSESVTRLLIDGEPDDWQPYETQMLTTSTVPVVNAFSNRDSIYLRLDAAALPADYASLTITLRLDTVDFRFIINRQQPSSALVSRLGASVRDLGPLAIAFAEGRAVEIRLPRTLIDADNSQPREMRLLQLQFAGADSASLSALPVDQIIPLLDESDGFARLDALDNGAATFALAGNVAQGAGRWQAFGRVNGLQLNPGETLTLQLDIRMDAPALPNGLAELRMIGRLRLQPIIGASGAQTAGGWDNNNGWSDMLTPSGLPISNIRGDFLISETTTPPTQVIRREGQLQFPLDFSVTLPDNLPPGIYIPLLEGALQVGDGERFEWALNNPLGTGRAAPQTEISRLPVVLGIGGVDEGRILWTLFQDTPSDGSRGLLAEEDQGRYGLVNGVRYDSPTYILPPSRDGEPILYPLEPYLLNQMDNRFDRAVAPLVPYLFPGGRLTVRVTRPDGQVDDLGSAALAQPVLSTAAVDERTVFGSGTPLDVYRVTTLNRNFSGYAFAQYGEYQIELRGSLDDVAGNRYTGGGLYRVLIAEPLDITPGVLPGTSFQVGDAFFPGLHLLPAVSGQVSVRLRLFPLDGGPALEWLAEGSASPDGFFNPSLEPFIFSTPGEYTVDYEVRFTDAQNRLWAGSLRSAGIVGSSEPVLVTHGQRGLASVGGVRPAWFIQQQVAPAAASAFNLPYHSGDIVWLPDGLTSRLNPTLRAQDVRGAYAEWLLNAAPRYAEANGDDLNRLRIIQELPLAILNPGSAPLSAALQPESISNQGYTYLSAVLPAVTARQVIQGGSQGGLRLDLDANDPLNGQAGAGPDGLRPGDVLFIFGGSILRNSEIGLADASIYGATAVVMPTEDEVGGRVLPPFSGETGGASGGPLFTFRGEPTYMFFHPTAVQPGSVLRVGDRFALAGQVAPSLASRVSVQITSPSGNQRAFSGQANAVGYYYDPSQDFTLDETGVWIVEVDVRHEGGTSAGQVEAPFPAGALRGASGGRFEVYVVPQVSEALSWGEDRTDFLIPPITPYNFRIEIPQDWSDVALTHTISIPGWVLEQGPLRLSGSTLQFQYSLERLNDDFPMLEDKPGFVGPAGADSVTLTFVATGSDSSGQRQIRTRTFTIAYDRLMTFG